MQWNQLFPWKDITKISTIWLKCADHLSLAVSLLFFFSASWLCDSLLFPLVLGMTVGCPWSSPMLLTKIWASMSAGSAHRDSLHSPTCSHMKVKENKLFLKWPNIEEFQIVASSLFLFFQFSVRSSFPLLPKRLHVSSNHFLAVGLTVNSRWHCLCIFSQLLQLWKCAVKKRTLTVQGCCLKRISYQTNILESNIPSALSQKKFILGRGCIDGLSGPRCRQARYLC